MSYCKDIRFPGSEMGYYEGRNGTSFCYGLEIFQLNHPDRRSQDMIRLTVLKHAGDKAPCYIEIPISALSLLFDHMIMAAQSL